MFQHRVNIEIEEGYDIPKNFRFDSIYAHRTSLDIDNFKKFNEPSKRRRILELVYSGFTSLASEFGWEQEFIDDAYDKSINENCHFVYHTDFKLSRNRKCKGRIRINLNKRLVRFTSEIIDTNSGEMQTVELLQTEEGNFAWWRSIREFGWLDVDNFGLKLMKGEIWVAVNTNTNEVNEIFKPKKTNTQQLEEFLRELKEPWW